MTLCLANNHCYLPEIKITSQTVKKGERESISGKMDFSLHGPSERLKKETKKSGTFKHHLEDRT